MQVNHIQIGDLQIASVESEEVLIRDPQDALELFYEVDSDFIVLQEHYFENDFFDLSTRKLGEIMQKFTNYRIKLAIIGDFARYKSKSLHDFIYESNKHGDYLFVSSIDEVKRMWGK